PQVRWGLGPATTLRFTSGAQASMLILEARRHREVGQAMVGRLNGQEGGRHTFGESFAFEEVRLALAPRPGPNQLRSEYSAWDEQAQRATAVLYRRLQILAQGLVEGADEAALAPAAAAPGSGGS